MSTFLIILDVVLVAIILAFVAVWLWNKFQTKRLGSGDLTNEEFNQGMRKAQIVDLREKAPFKRKHIDGARNLPYTTLKYQYGELRSDLPVYLYSDSLTVTLRAARFLQKKHFTSIKWLKNGFDEWNGRTKTSKY
ncbi:rhodanese-like domain-containing protein [Lactobacillus sp. ESL0731]|uniref:rhodanese-like domain-containing protein n=1 Tax=unclassified Lactobacillus TaxID=2620435 RepID=UPI0023FA080F|nr:MULTISPECIES: rhodanese-like domain-containing protein [unclassified Lactobacillus]WEV50536.1 rhodanese-like domain-containing protein [Lactobacillus sp. ESL0700]WEV61666.1 rhodanese-like domain-containing protein [Lactobacillus sp. ESL0731]